MPLGIAPFLSNTRGRFLLSAAQAYTKGKTGCAMTERSLRRPPVQSEGRRYAEMGQGRGQPDAVGTPATVTTVDIFIGGFGETREGGVVGSIWRRSKHQVATPPPTTNRILGVIRARSNNSSRAYPLARRLILSAIVGAVPQQQHRRTICHTDQSADND